MDYSSLDFQSNNDLDSFIIGKMKGSGKAGLSATVLDGILARGTDLKTLRKNRRLQVRLLFNRQYFQVDYWNCSYANG